MPRVSVWLVRAALAHLALGFTTGALLLVNKALALSPTLWRLVLAHIELVLVGWTVQLVMGVAVWILPRVGLQRASHGRLPFAWAAFGLVNAGVVLAAVGGALGDARLELSGRVAEIGAALAFLLNVWTRVAPAGLSQI